MKAYIPNPGFYESIFSHVIDSECEHEADYLQEYEGMPREDAGAEACQHICTKDTEESICRAYVSLFQGWLKGDIGLDINLTFSRIISPAFYNFESDKIEVEMTEEDARKLYDALIKLPDVRDAIACAGTPCSGYSPFVSPDWQHEGWQLENLCPASWYAMLTPFYNACMENESRFYDIEEAARNAIIY